MVLTDKDFIIQELIHLLEMASVTIDDLIYDSECSCPKTDDTCLRREAGRVRDRIVRMLYSGAGNEDIRKYFFYPEGDHEH